MSSLRWTLACTHLVKVYMNDNQGIAKQPNKALTSEMHSQLDGHMSLYSKTLIRPHLLAKMKNKIWDIERTFCMYTILTGRSYWELSCPADHCFQFTFFLSSTILLHCFCRRCLSLSTLLSFFPLISPTRPPQPLSHCNFQLITLRTFHFLNPLCRPPICSNHLLMLASVAMKTVMVQSFPKKASLRSLSVLRHDKHLG